VSGNILKRHVGGESVFMLGTLYDIRRDVFLHESLHESLQESLFEKRPSDGAVELTSPPVQTTTSTIKIPINFQERCDMIKIGLELGPSILSGLCNARGHWERFLMHQDPYR